MLMDLYGTAGGSGEQKTAFSGSIKCGEFLE